MAMAESNIKINSDNQSINEDETIIKLNKQIYFTRVQIENLLKLQSFINVEPQNCVSIVSTTLKLEDIEENNINFWLADTIAAIVKNIQLSHMNLLQGTTAVRWILFFVSLAVGEEKLSKIELFKNLRKCIKFALENAEECMIPLPNIAECPKYVSISIRNSQKIRKSENIHVTAVQIISFILDAIREIFWDDFKYNLIQMAFKVDPIEAKETEYFIRQIEPVYQSNDNSKNIGENEVKSYECQDAAIMNRYFLRKFDYDPSLQLFASAGLQRPFCLTPARSLVVSDDAILPLSAANLTKNAEKYIEKLRTENLQK